MKRLELYFAKIGRKNYAVSGKAKPCSSLTKIMVYVTRKFLKLHIEEGHILIEGGKEDKDGEKSL